MTPARDDYPYIAHHARHAGFDRDRDQCRGALAELDHLRRWKREAIEVLSAWDLVWEVAGRPGPLGRSKAENVRRLLAESDDTVSPPQPEG